MGTIQLQVESRGNLKEVRWPLQTEVGDGEMISDAQSLYDVELKRFSAELRKIKGLAKGPTFEALASSVYMSKSQVHAIFHAKIKKPPNRDVVFTLLGKIDAYARRSPVARSDIVNIKDWEIRFDRVVRLYDACNSDPILERISINDNLAGLELQVDASRIVLLPEGGLEPLAVDSHEGAGSRLATMLFELYRSRRRMERPESQPFVQSFSAEISQQLPHSMNWTGAIGSEMGVRFFGGKVGDGIREYVNTVATEGGHLRLALQCSDVYLAGLPWEAAVPPGLDAALAIHKNLEFFRRLPSPYSGVLRLTPRPLRILTLIANPMTHRGLSGLHERGLEEIVASVDAARRSRLAYIETPLWGNLEALQWNMRSKSYHVLYLTCPLTREGLLLEGTDGTEELVTPHRLVESVVIPSQQTPILLLRAFATESPEDFWPMLQELSERFGAAGSPAVLLIPPTTSHEEVVHFTSRLYMEAAANPQRTLLEVITVGRRRLHDKMLQGKQFAASPSPSAMPILFLPRNGIDQPVTGEDYEEPPMVERTALAEGMPVRGLGEFVGRGPELRKILSTLQGANPQIVVSGIGGVGKSTLAAHAMEILGQRTGVLVALSGVVAPDVILGTLARRLRSWSLGEANERGFSDRLIAAIRNVRLHWRERLELIADHVLPRVAVTLLLDNFEDNQDVQASGDGRIRERELEAFIESWVNLQDSARLVITSRHSLTFPNIGEGWLLDLHLGPLTLSEARRLVWRLPALDALPDADLRAAVAAVGGHPRALEFLDALLRGGHASLHDVEVRLRKVLRAQKLPIRSTGCGMVVRASIASSPKRSH
jgi:hypothetical protein